MYICGYYGKEMKKLLKNKGKLFLVHRTFRLSEILCQLSKDGLEPKRIRFVHPYIDKEPNIFLLEAVKGGKSRMTVEPPLIVYEKKENIQKKFIRFME